jgi:hypothetical protein
MDNMPKNLFFFWLFNLAAQAALADHAGLQIEDGSGSAITTIGAETLNTSQQILAVQYQYLTMDELSDELLLASDEPLHSINAFAQVSVGYSRGISDRFTVSAVLPYVGRDDFRESVHLHSDPDEPEHHEEGGPEDDHDDEPEFAGEVSSSDLSGWGDLSLLGRYALNNPDSAHRLTLLGGIKTPTGSTNERLSSGEKAEVEHQPGSGSWDALGGFAYSSRLSAQWNIRSNLLYQLTSEGKRDTEVGNSMMYNAAVVWSPPPHTHHVHAHTDQRWQLVLELNGEWRDKTQVNSVKDNNTGGNVIFATVGLRWNIADWSTQIALAAPIHEDFNGIQSEPEWRLSSGIAFAF